MWGLVIFLCLTITWAEAQNGRGPQYQDHNGHGWDIRLAVPGEPGNDYPTLGAIPRTDFSCAGKEPGYYADIETNCQVFRVCTVGSTYGFQSFLCPNGTLFNQAVFVCDWWMNVNCKTSQQLINNNNEKFGNLRLGPQLMKDIKKMLTHPMRNPYDKSIMKSNLIVMQDYKPPTGQLFPNGALLAGPERPPNNVYVPSKQIQQNFIQSNPTEYTFSASTPEPQYVSAPTNTNFPSIQKDESFVQKQQQSGQYIRTGRVQSLQNSQHSSNLISNSHAGQFLPNSNSNFNNNNAFGEFSQVTRPTQVTTFTQRKTNTVLPTTTSSTQNNQRNLTNRQRSQFSESKRTSQATDGKHSDIGDTFTESRNNKKFPPGLPKFSNEIKNGKAGRELKDNLALVYSFLTDSINIAREHRHIAQQEVLSSTVTPTPAHFQSLNNQQLSDITNKISQLTSSQFSSNLKYSNEHQARQLQNPQFNGYPSRNTQNDLYSSRFQRPNTQQNIEQNVLNNQNEIYSGQLYRWPVPEVTNQIYNQPTSANLINSNSFQHPTTHLFTLQRNTNQNNAGSNLKQTTPAVEIIKAETINLNPAKLQLEPSYESNQITNTENLTNLRDSENGISAKLQDMIVGTIPHPIENNKVVTYKTDRSYYLYTKPEDNRIENFNTITQTNTNTPKDAQLMQSSKTPDSETFQLIPSVNYELEDVEEQQQILDAFQIDEFGAPRDIIKQKITAGKTNQNEVTSSVEHDTSTMRSDIGKTDSPYSGPSSYTAPQSSVGSLEKRQNIQNHFNSKLEDFDNNNSNGYPKERPARQFVF